MSLIPKDSRMLYLAIWSDGPSFYVGWMTLALLNAGLAQSKNRSGLLWWLLSLFLGPLATFVLVAFCNSLPPVRP